MKKINIYLTKEENTKLSIMCAKYQVSKSTIAEWVLFYLTKYLMQEKQNELIEKIGNEYIRKDKGSKTCITPKLDPVNNGKYKNLSKAYTNAIHMYLSKAIKNYLTESHTTAFNNELNHRLQTTDEPNWNYNQFIRNIWRYQKKERTKK